MTRQFITRNFGNGPYDDHQQLFFDLPIESVSEAVGELGEPAYRAKQVLQGAYKRLVPSFAEMTDLPQEFRFSIEIPVSTCGRLR